MDGGAWQCTYINVNIQAYSDRLDYSMLGILRRNVYYTKNKVKNEDNTHIVKKKTSISNAVCLRVQQQLKQSSKRRRLERKVQTLSDAWRWRQQRCLSADEADCCRHQVQTPTRLIFTKFGRTFATQETVRLWC